MTPSTKTLKEKAYQKQYREINKEELKIVKKAWRLKNKDKIKRYRESIRDKSIAYKKRLGQTEKYKSMRRIRQSTPHSHIIRRLWSKTEKGKQSYKKSFRIRRYRERNIKENFTYEELIQKKMKQNNICKLCKVKKKLTLDHIIPISKAPEGFIYAINDIQFLCHSCNASKGAKIESND